MNIDLWPADVFLFHLVELLAQLKSTPSNESNGKSRTAGASDEKDSGPRKRVNSDSRSSAPDYTKDQLEAVRKVKT